VIAALMSRCCRFLSHVLVLALLQVRGEALSHVLFQALSHVEAGRLGRREDILAAAWVCWARLTLRDPCQFSGGSGGGYFGFYQSQPMIVLSKLSL